MKRIILHDIHFQFFEKGSLNPNMLHEKICMDAATMHHMFMSIYRVKQRLFPYE